MNDEDESGALWDDRRRPRRAHPILRFVGKWLLVATIWMMIFPSLRRVDRFEPANK